jgi:ribosomal protein L35AE/L33A
VVVKAINKDIEKEMKRRGIKEEIIKEGTWAVPDTKDKMKSLNNLMKKPLVIKGDNDAKKASNTLGNIIGDDGVEDEWLKMASEYRKGSAAMDARDVIDKFLKDWGFTVKNHQITHYPVDILDEDDIQEKGNLKKPKRGKLLKLDNEPSRSQQVKEDYEHAKDSPFKLKSQQYPRAVAINNDGFGKRHATVEDIISACDSFGMILDKELQVEQIQKQLGKVGFISYKKSELEDVFHERETQRVILALESVTEEQEPISYCQGEIAYAQLHEREIEFLKPDGQKAVGPVLKMGGNTYNVKDKFTGKSYTYKYTGETEVKSFKEVVNEGRFSSKLVKQAGGIAFDKRYYMGNMSGAIDAIEKLKKGLSDDPKVKEMLKIANEGVDEWVSKDGTRRRVKERDQRKYNKLKEWEDAIEASGDKEAYQKFFNKAMKKFGVSSPDELEGDKKKEFFDYVDKNWKGDHEEVEQDVHKSYRVDGRRKNFREKMKKLGYIKRY